MKVSRHVHMPVPPAVLWRLVSDPEAWPRWMEGVVGVEVESCNAGGAAYQWIERFRSPTTGAIIGIRHRLVRRVEGREFVWELVSWGPGSLGIYQAITPEPNGHGTELMYSIKVERPVLLSAYPSLESREGRSRVLEFITSSLKRLTVLLRPIPPNA